MHKAPNREKMSPAAKGREIMPHLRWNCPCCGGSMGIRAAFRANPRVEYIGYKPHNEGEVIKFHRMIGQKGNTLRDKRK